MAINGTIVHIVALLTDRGIPLQVATGALSIAGIAIIVGRMICGWCLDRYWGPYVAVCFFALPMAGIALLGSGWAYPVPLLGAALCGAGIGAEIDLIGVLHQPLFRPEGLWKNLRADVHAVQPRHRPRSGVERTCV